MASFRRKLAEALTVRGELELARKEFAPALGDASTAVTLLEKLDDEAGGVAIYRRPLSQKAGLAEAFAAQARLKTHSGISHPRSECMASAREANPSHPRLPEEAQRLESLRQELKP